MSEISILNVQSALTETSPGDAPRATFEIFSQDPIKSAYGVVFVKRPPQPAAVNEPAGVAPQTLRATELHAENRDAIVRQLGSASWGIEVALRDIDVASDGQVMVVALTSTGQVIPTNVRQISDANRGATQPTGVPPECPKAGESTPPGRLLALDQENLSKVIEIREKRNAVLLNKIRSELTVEKLRTLSGYEKRFKLRYLDSLGRDIPIQALARRLSAVQALDPLSDPTSARK